MKSEKVKGVKSDKICNEKWKNVIKRKKHRNEKYGIKT